MSFKEKKSIINAMIIFYSLIVLKLVFLCIWAIHKTGTIDLNYLQYPDEHFYFAEWHFGYRVSNLYHLLVGYMKEAGFGISNIKMLNIYVSSLAIVRLYTLREFVRDKNKYLIYLLVLGGFLFLHVIYYSIFILKDTLFFYVTVEFLIQLIKRPRDNRWGLIICLCTILMLIRPPMILGFTVFLFDKKWHIQYKKVLLFVLSIAIFMIYCGRECERKFYTYIAYGLSENLRIEGSKNQMKEYAQTILSRNPKVYLELVITNIKEATSFFYHKDITYQLILFLEWCIAFYLLIIKKNVIHVIKFWPIIAVAILYFIGGSLTLYNMRYNLFPVTFLLYLTIFASSKPLMNFK